MENPFDIVHLSKPRFVNILIGVLYKLIWGSQIFMDVDDEDLGILKERQETIPLDSFFEQNQDRELRWSQLVTSDGVRVGVALWDIFDGVTVSNPALKEKYGGLILPHARSANQFQPDIVRKNSVRREFGIPLEAKVFLFFGTVRKHKGVVETARAMAKTGRKDAIFVVAGSIPDRNLTKELKAVGGKNLRLLPVQPFERIPDIVGMADAVVLLQDDSSLLAKYQLPAKLVDAMAMGLTIFVSPTPAVQDVIDAGAARAIFRNKIEQSISDYLSSPEDSKECGAAGRKLFLDQFSVEACDLKLRKFLEERRARNSKAKKTVFTRVTSVFEEIGGWEEIAKLDKCA
ncbi:glycosyltransferase family 4 protein [Ruegeria arenilitoris]|uniref:glycosyltransferase family 4 protein n=1 Tax=Ruegeria arenilitoris TaxID=1173585 RepID=UPI001479A625|nr:glycosyltransferase family 4 protein [Ruegeria arenilitoris]